MKKLGKKVSFLTKIMLVIGLLVSNLSSLTYAFASETTENVNVTLTEDGNLEIKYLEELTEVESVNVKVTENYTYLDGTNEEKVSDNEVLVTDFLSNGVTQPTIMTGQDPDALENIEVFDGLYEVKVEITDLEGEKIDSAIYSKNVEHKKGLEIKLYDEEEEILASESGKYSLTKEQLNVDAKARVLAGGLSPKMLFKYEGQEYLALQLVTELVFDYSYDFTGLLYGDYSTLLAVKLLQKVDTASESLEEEFEEVVISQKLDFAFEKYSLNTEAMNFFVERAGLYGAYSFSGNTKNGVIYTVLDLSEEPKARTMLDLYKIAEVAFGGIDTIDYVLSNSSSEDIVKAYEELTTPEVTPEGSEEETQVVADTTSEEKTLEEYLSEIILDDSASLKVSGVGLTEEDEGITLTYDVTVLGDINKDGKLDNADLIKLIEESVTGKVSDKLTSDVALLDGKVNTLDVMLLNKIINTKDWYSSLGDAIEGKLLAKLEVSKEEITSGDTFEVQYVLSLADYDVNGLAGLFKYNKEVFELVSMEVDNKWTGYSKDGKFLYLTDELLTAPEVTEPEETPVVTPEQDSNSNDGVVVITEGDTTSGEVAPEETPVVTEDYVILTATFKALKASSLEDGNVITLDNVELFNDDVYMELDTTKVESDVIVVNADTNNKLASLKVAGQEIELQDDVYEYELVVKNEVTTVDLEYVLESATATISSIVAPEELAEGENKITITVVSESGLEQVYTVVVTREAAPKKEVVVSTDNYYGDYDNNQEEEIIVTPGATEEEEPATEEKSGTLSRVIIIVLILLVIAGLIYLIFKDEDDSETKKANKEINKLKKEDKEIVVEKTTKVEQKPTKKADNSNKKKSPKNKKKER